MIEAIILAAGFSSRMGEANKLLLPFRGKVILQHTVDALLDSQIDRVVVVTGHGQEKICLLLADKKVNFIHNEQYQQGQLTSIQTGLSQLSVNCNSFLICLSDMPLLTAKDYNDLIQTYQISSQFRSIVMPHNGERAGNPKLFHIDYKEEILALNSAEHQGAKVILEQYSDRIIPYRTANASFFLDIDTPTAYQALLKI